jgi:hypothetical protein
VRLRLFLALALLALLGLALLGFVRSVVVRGGDGW